ncbi:hypothetical protein DRO64_05030 [Candidatus Bathyarchaeota archaeon]|nr:MAG: hypothetical protein DRO64_05030 [Candidatus Bathyarchaeota archaeon]
MNEALKAKSVIFKFLDVIVFLLFRNGSRGKVYYFEMNLIREEYVRIWLNSPLRHQCKVGWDGLN